MKKSSFNLTGKAIDCLELPALGAAGKEIFRALKVACNGFDNPEYAIFENISKWGCYLVTDEGEYVMETYEFIKSHKAFLKPSDVLGQAAIDAAMKGGTIVFEGDPIPKSMRLMTWGKVGSVIAYKLLQENQPLSEEASMNTQNTKHTKAAEILKAAQKHMEARAITYDKPQGERSMKATVEAFNAVTGHDLTEEQGWHFMTILKIVRSQQGNYKLDNYEDGSAYFGLAGEAASKERN